MRGCGVRRRGEEGGREGWRKGELAGQKTYLATVDALGSSGMRLQVLVREELPAAEAAGEVDD